MTDLNLLIKFFISTIFESFCNGFVSLCSYFVPNKQFSDKAQRIILIVFIVLAFILLIGLVVGIFIVVKTSGKSFWGWMLISLNVIYIISGVLLKLVFRKK